MVILILITAILIAAYYYATRNLDYWSKRGIKHDPPIPLFGNHLINQLGIKSHTVIATELYNKYPDEKVIGYYRGTTPELIINDLDLVRQILSVDFNSFHMRGFGRSEKKEPLFLTLFHGEGDRWRLLRQKLSAAFTSAKLKAMFPLVVQCAEKLQNAVKTDEVIDARELMARFSTEFIGACGFGIEMDSINNENSKFRALGKRIFTRTRRNLILVPFGELFPALKPYYRIGEPEVVKALYEIVEGIRQQRNYKPIGRNDYIDLLLDLESQGKIVGESIEKQNPDGSPVQVELKFDIHCMVSQVFIFFNAGFETSSSTTSYCLHELAFHPEILAKVHEDIDRVMLKYNNKLCLDALSEMNYLEMTFKEAMRIFPVVGNINRICTKRYKIEDLNITVDRDVKILIPVQAIHMDEKYYDNPKEFRPERFTPEEVLKRSHYAYLPFGMGPRNCVGAKLGLMQSLAGLAALLHEFTVEPAPGTKREMELDHTANMIQGVKGIVPVVFRRRKLNKKYV